MGKTLDELLAEVRELQARGELPDAMTIEQEADWAYSNAVQHNPDITLEMAREAVRRRRVRDAREKALESPQNQAVLEGLARRDKE